MKRAFLALPGPIPVKVIIAVVLVVLFLVVLNFVYGWLGNLLDSGGAVG
ncbi:MAG: hypothetical protein ACR2N7_02400 [Acidimicrobiia bacterium]